MALILRKTYVFKKILYYSINSTLVKWRNLVRKWSENIVMHWSVAQTGSIDEKNGGRKSTALLIQ